MENKIKRKSIKSFKSQNSTKVIKIIDPIISIYFDSKISPEFYKTYINK